MMLLLLVLGWREWLQRRRVMINIARYLLRRNKLRVVDLRWGWREYATIATPRLGLIQTRIIEHWFVTRPASFDARWWACPHTLLLPLLVVCHFDQAAAKFVVLNYRLLTCLNYRWYCMRKSAPRCAFFALDDALVEFDRRRWLVTLWLNMSERDSDMNGYLLFFGFRCRHSRVMKRTIVIGSCPSLSAFTRVNRYRDY